MPRVKLKKIQKSASHTDLYVKFSRDLKALVVRSMAIMDAEDKISNQDKASMIMTGLAKGGLIVEHVCQMTPGTFLAFVKLAGKEADAKKIFKPKD
jgi:predicted peptidase